MIKLAENTIDKKDYKTLINFLQKKKLFKSVKSN